jgi:hypothetical protein
MQHNLVIIKIRLNNHETLKRELCTVYISKLFKCFPFLSGTLCYLILHLTVILCKTVFITVLHCIGLH